MAINFPANPNPNDIHPEPSLGKSWIWDGVTWKIYSSTTTGIGYSDLSVVTDVASGGGSLTYNDANGQFTFRPAAGSGGGATNFTGLGDTPGSLSAGKWLKVNTGGTALEWTDAPSGSDTNDYLNTASLSGNILTLTRTGSQSLGNVTVDLSSLNSVPTTITVTDESTQTVCYPLFTTVATGNLEPKTGTNIKFNSASGQLEAGSFKKTGGTAAEFLKADGSIDSTSYLSSVALNDLSDVDATTNLANGKILKYDSTANSGSGGWLVADDNTSGGGSANFTGLSDTPSSHSNNKWLKSDGSSLVWADAPIDTQLSVEEVQDIVGGMFTGNTETNITATYEDSDGTIDLVVSGSDTTYDLTAGADSGNAKVTLTPSSGTDDVVTFSAGGGISYAVTGNTIQISSSNSLGALTDTNISGSPTDNYVLTYDTASSKWEPQPVPGGSQNLFSTVAVSGQSNVVADTTTDTLTFAAGSNMTITTDANNDVITFASAGSGSLNIKYVQQVGPANNNYISYFTGVQGGYANYQFDTNYPTGFQSQSWNNWGGWINPWNAGGQQGDGLLFFTLSDNSETTWDLKLHSTSPNTSLTSGNQCRCWTSTDGVNWVYDGANNSISTTNSISITSAYLIVTDLGMGQGNEVYLEVGSSTIGGTNYLSQTGLSVTKLSNQGTGNLTYNNAGTLTYTPPELTGTTYDLTAAANAGSAKITLTPSSGTADDVNLTAGGGISYAVTGNTIEISSSNSLGGLSDVSISGSPNPGEVIKYVSGTGWTNSTDATGGGSDGNDYVTNLSLSGTTLTAEFGNTSLNQTIDLASINSNTQLSTEQVQDIVGAMFSGNTETNITATYQDSDGTIDLDVSGGGTDTTYDLTAAASSGNAKITLTDSNGSPDDVTLTAGGGISYAVTGNTIEIISANSLGALSDVSISGSPTPGQVIKYVSGTGWTNSSDATGGGSDGNDYVTNLSLSGSTLTASFSNTALNQTVNLGGINSDTTYSISCVDGDNADEEKIQILSSSNSPDDIVLEAGTGLSIARSGDKITFTNTVSNTTLNLIDEDDMSSNSSTRPPSQQSVKAYVDNNSGTTYSLTGTSSGSNARINLTPSGGTADIVTLTPGGGISYSTSGNNIEIYSKNTLTALDDTNYSGTPSDNDILKWSSSGGVGGSGAWILGSQSPSTNNYANSLSFNTSTGVLTLGMSGLSNLTVDLDGRYATGTIPTNNNQLTNGAGYITSAPTNNNQLTNGAGYITSSGTAANANNVKIRTDSGAAWHPVLFVDSDTDNLNQTLKVDASGLKYYPSANWLQSTTMQSYLLYSWASSSGTAGDVLTSGGSGAWTWEPQSSGGMTGQSSITVKTSGNGNITLQNWTKTVIAALVGAGGGGGSAMAFYDDDDGGSTGYGGGGGSGGVSFYTGNFTPSSSNTISYSVGTGGTAQVGNCDDSAKNGSAGTGTGFGGVTAGGGGGGQGVGRSGSGSGGSGGSGSLAGMPGGSGVDNNMRAIAPFWGKYGYGGRGGDGTGLTGNDGGCNNGAENGENGAIIILELG